MIYPDVCCNSGRRDFDLKSEFQIKSKEYKEKKTVNTEAKIHSNLLLKNIVNYFGGCNNFSCYLTNNDGFLFFTVRKITFKKS